MRRPPSVLIVGAGLAGARCAETLRAEGFDGQIVLVGDEPYPPYERPSLSKELLAATVETSEILLRPNHFWAERGIELILETRIEKIDVSCGTAVSVSGKSFSWDALVVATGAKPKRLPGPALPGVHTLRSLTDALALREELRPGRRLVVVGAGFVGTEVASTALGCDVEVVLLEAGGSPLERILGPDVGRVLADWYRRHGVDLKLGVGLTGFQAARNGALRRAELADDTAVDCDAAVVALGVAPDRPVLPGLPGTGEVSTDASGRTALPGVYACGDVANAWRPGLAARQRIEHWTNAAGQGAAVARAILGREAPHDEVPYFWSDQFGLRLQYVGHADTWASLELEGDEESFSARYLDRDGQLLAALLANRGREVGAVRRELAAGRLAA